MRQEPRSLPSTICKGSRSLLAALCGLTVQHAAFVCSSDVLRLLPVPVNRLRSPSSAFTARQPPWSPPEEAGQGRNMQNAEASRGSRWLEDISGKRLRRSLDQFRSYQSKTPALTSGLAVASQTLSSILFSTCYFCKQWYSKQFATGRRLQQISLGVV